MVLTCAKISFRVVSTAECPFVVDLKLFNVSMCLKIACDDTHKDGVYIISTLALLPPLKLPH